MAHIVDRGRRSSIGVVLLHRTLAEGGRAAILARPPAERAMTIGSCCLPARRDTLPAACYCHIAPTHVEADRVKNADFDTLTPRRLSRSRLRDGECYGRRRRAARAVRGLVYGDAIRPCGVYRTGASTDAATAPAVHVWAQCVPA